MSAFAATDLGRHNGAMSDVTRILSQIESGDPSAAEQLLPLVYNELRKLAAAKLDLDMGETAELVEPGGVEREFGLARQALGELFAELAAGAAGRPVARDAADAGR